MPQLLQGRAREGKRGGANAPSEGFENRGIFSTGESGRVSDTSGCKKKRGGGQKT